MPSSHLVSSHVCYCCNNVQLEDKSFEASVISSEFLESTWQSGNNLDKSRSCTQVAEMVARRIEIRVQYGLYVEEKQYYAPIMDCLVGCSSNFKQEWDMLSMTKVRTGQIFARSIDALIVSSAPSRLRQVLETLWSSYSIYKWCW